VAVSEGTSTTIVSVMSTVGIEVGSDVGAHPMINRSRIELQMNNQSFVFIYQ